MADDFFASPGALLWWETWSGNRRTAEGSRLQTAYQELVRRTLRWSSARVSFFVPGSLGDDDAARRRGPDTGLHTHHPPVATRLTIDGGPLEDREWVSRDADATLPNNSVESLQRLALYENLEELAVDCSRWYSFSPWRLWRLIERLRRGVPHPFRLTVLCRCGRVGVAITDENATAGDPPSPGRLIQSYISWSLLDQFQQEAYHLRRAWRDLAEALVRSNVRGLLRAWVADYALGLQFESARARREIAAALQHHGIATAWSGDESVVVTSSPALRGAARDDLRRAIMAVLSPEEPSLGNGETASRATSDCGFHTLFLQLKRAVWSGQDTVTLRRIQEYGQRRLTEIGLPDADIVWLDQSVFEQWRDAIARRQLETYEPARVTPIEKFQQLIRSPRQVSVLVVRQGAILAMAFAGPLGEFVGIERGVDTDPWRDDERIAYVLDLTVAPAHRGRLGRLTKELLTLMATARGFHAIHGRNRDRLAAAMWSINLSLGAYQVQHLIDDYRDDHPFRDCLYYRCPLRWAGWADLSSGADVPSPSDCLDEEAAAELVDAWVRPTEHVVNAHGTARQARNLPKWLGIRRPVHTWTASSWRSVLHDLTLRVAAAATPDGDVTREVLWVRPAEPRPGVLLSEDVSWLSGSAQVVFQPSVWQRCRTGQQGLMKRLQSDRQRPAAVWLEVLPMNSMVRMAAPSARAWIATCRDYRIPIIVVETGSLFYRWGGDAFAACGEMNEEIDGVVIHQGSHAAWGAWLRDPPLTLPAEPMATHGDPVDLALFWKAIDEWERTPNALAVMRHFDEQLIRWLEVRGVHEISVERGVGWFRGSLPDPADDQMFQTSVSGRRLICASLGHVQWWLENRCAT